MAMKTWTGATSGDWSVSGNWSPSGAPATGDDVYFDGTSAVDVDSGLAQSAVTLASLTISAAYLGKIGTATAYLAISATVLTIGTQPQSDQASPGSNRIKIDLGTNASSVTVISTNTTTADTGKEPVRLLGTNVANTLTVAKGRVGVATTTAGETATFATVEIVGQGSVVNLGSGVTLTTATNNGGTLTIQSAVTTLNAIAGTTTVRGAGVITTANAVGGLLNLWNRPGGTALTTLNWNGGTLNTKGMPGGYAIGATNVDRGGSISVFSASQVTWGTFTIDPTNGGTITASLN